MDSEDQHGQDANDISNGPLPSDSSEQRSTPMPPDNEANDPDFESVEPEDNQPPKSPENYGQFMPQLKPKKTWPRAVGWILFIIALGALAGGGWWYVNQKSNSKPANNTPGQQSPNAGNTSVNTKPYTSGDLNLSLNYPSGWNISDTRGKLTVVSGAMQITGANGQKQNGQIKLTIQNANAADFSMFKHGDAVAVLTSQRISYTNPAANQRGTTYVSFLQYADTTAHGQLDGVFLTGDLGYQYGQTIPESDIVKIDPDVRVTFLKCSDQNCQTTVALGVSSADWNDAKFSTPIVNIIKSLQIQ